MSLLQNCFSAVVEVTLTTSGILLLLLVLMPVLRRHYTARWRCWVWLLVAIRLLVPCNVSLPRVPVRIDSPAQRIVLRMPARREPVPARTAGQTAVPAVQTPAAPARAVALDGALSILWVAGVAGFLLYHLGGYLLFCRNVRRYSRPADDAETCRIWRETLSGKGTHGSVRLLVCRKIRSPMTAGFFHPVLLLPEATYPEAGLRMIFRHELIHDRRGDVWYKFLMICANAVHWFNPLVYLMVAASSRDLEFSCDSAVVCGADGEERRAYSEAILATARSGKGMYCSIFSTHFSGGGKAMKQRLMNIFDRSRKRNGIPALCAILVIMGILGALVAPAATGAVDTSRFRTATTGVAIDVDYASKTRVIFHGYFGLFVYDTAGHGQLERSLDLQKIGCACMQGSVWTQITVSRDGGTVYIERLGEAEDGVMYRYDVEEDRLSRIRTQKVADPYMPGDMADRLTTCGMLAQDGSGMPSGTYGQIDEDTYAYLWDRDGIVKDLELIIENTHDHSFQAYDVFRPEAEQEAERAAKDLLSQKLLAAKAEGRIISFDLDDYENNGQYEAFALVGQDAADRGAGMDDGTLWFVSKNDLICLEADNVFVPSSKPTFYAGNDEFFKIEEEAFATGSRTLVFGVRNGRAYASPISGQVQDLEQLEDGTFTGEQNTLDAFQDGTGRTVKPYWFYWENGFHEYGGIRITRKQLLEFRGADRILQGITAHGNVLTDIIYRADGVINVNYQTPQGACHFATLQYDDSGVQTVFSAEENDGVYDPALLPAIAAYPSTFRHPDGADTDLAQAQREKCAWQWAEAVRNRDGKAQYDLLSTRLQQVMRASYEEEGWVTGQSSPWVQNYRVSAEGNGVVVTYFYATSTGSAGAYRQVLTFVKENGALRIDSLSTLQEVP